MQRGLRNIVSSISDLISTFNLLVLTKYEGVPTELQAPSNMMQSSLPLGYAIFQRLEMV